MYKGDLFTKVYSRDPFLFFGRKVTIKREDDDFYEYSLVSINLDNNHSEEEYPLEIVKSTKDNSYFITVQISRSHNFFLVSLGNREKQTIQIVKFKDNGKFEFYYELNDLQIVGLTVGPMIVTQRDFVVVELSRVGISENFGFYSNDKETVTEPNEGVHLENFPKCQAEIHIYQIQDKMKEPEEGNQIDLTNN